MSFPDVAHRQLRRWAVRHHRPTDMRAVLAEQRRAGERIAASVRVAYFFPAFWISYRALDWQSTALPEHPVWIWPVAWLSWFDTADAGPVLFGVCVVASVLGALFSEFRVCRVVAFIGLVEFLGLHFSLGKIHHLMHGWVLLLFALIWLPGGFVTPVRLSRRDVCRMSTVYVGAQLLVGVTYSLAGLGKLLGVVVQLARGEVTSLHPSSLARHISARLLETNDVSLWGPWLIERGEWLWPMMLGTLYLQLFALVFVMRPALHRLLGYGLVAFHVLAPLSLMIDFSPAIVLCGMLYVASAVAPEQTRLSSVLFDLPLVGWGFRWLHSKREGIRLPAIWLARQGQKGER